jgi:MFS family permease
MELEELKMTWETLSQHMKRESAISLALYTDHKLTRVRSRLRPLLIGQVLQIFFGIPFVLLAALLWSSKPTAVSVIIAGVVIHAYGIGCIITAGIVLGAMHKVDYSGSVLDIQEKLARVRRAYIVGGIVVGLTWWFLWIPLLMVLLALVHVNLYAHAPSVVWIGMAVGILGLASMLWLYARSREPGHERLRRFVDQAAVGRSLRRAQAQLDEVRQFAQEQP